MSNNLDEKVLEMRRVATRKRKKAHKSNRPEQGAIYHQFSHLYERIFSRMFSPRLNYTIGSLKIPRGAKVLEVGVGTGISLPFYPAHADVTAIDLSEDMLEKAEQKIQAHDWGHITLQKMNAMDLQFPDESFDYVTAFHIASVVPDPVRLMHEMFRVCKPGGTLVIVNHFRSEKKWLGPLMDLLDPVTRRIGWRTTLRFSDLVDRVPVRVEERFKTSRQSLFTVVVARKPSGDSDRQTLAEDFARRRCSIRPWKNIRGAWPETAGRQGAKGPEGKRKLRIGRWG